MSDSIEYKNAAVLALLKELILIKLINQKSLKSITTTISTTVLNLIQKSVIIVTEE